MRVSRPTRPSTPRKRARWKARTAASVAASRWPVSFPSYAPALEERLEARHRRAVPPGPERRPERLEVAPEDVRRAAPVPVEEGGVDGRGAAFDDEDRAAVRHARERDRARLVGARDAQLEDRGQVEET